MTCLDKLKENCPDYDSALAYVLEHCCPDDFNIMNDPENCDPFTESCDKCWAREIPGTEKTAAETYNPVQKAYDLVVGFAHHGKTTDFEEVIGYLGEALDEHSDSVYAIDREAESELANDILPDWPKDNPHISDAATKAIQKVAEAACRAGASIKAMNTTLSSSIKDSGDRTRFESGAVRDMREGKGRCDLMPLQVAGEWLKDDILGCIAQFQRQGSTVFLYGALNYFNQKHGWDAYDQNEANCTMLLEVAKHFEDGAKKYGENNWQKGIPVHCYIDSAVRHYLKWLRGDKDEPHDRAFVWNLLCCIWEVDYREKEKA